ncbi:MAG: insulinase family protein, partial [Phormidesmis sp.]
MGLLSRHMRDRFLPFLFLAIATFAILLTLAWPKPAQAIESKNYEDLVYPPLGEIQIPDYERYELDIGLVAYLMEDHDLPLVGGSATFRTGAYLVSAGQDGLA